MIERSLKRNNELFVGEGSELPADQHNYTNYINQLGMRALSKISEISLTG
jgi:hypothetical protein